MKTIRSTAILRAACGVLLTVGALSLYLVIINQAVRLIK